MIWKYPEQDVVPRTLKWAQYGSVDLASSFLLTISRPRTTCFNCLNEIPDLRASNMNENQKPSAPILRNKSTNNGVSGKKTSQQSREQISHSNYTHIFEKPKCHTVKGNVFLEKCHQSNDHHILEKNNFSYMQKG